MTRLLLYLGILPLLALALDFVSTYGPYLVNNRTNQRITINGVHYALYEGFNFTEPVDPLTDAESCTRDAALMSRLGLNTIYVMHLNVTQNHDDCFSIFNSVGIYVILALREWSLRSTIDPSGNYTTEYMKNTFEKIDAVKDYENLLALEVGLIDWAILPNRTYFAENQKHLRSYIRDTKDYITHNSPRPIIVGGSSLGFSFRGDQTELSEISPFHYATCNIPDETIPSEADFFSFLYYDYSKNETEVVKKTNASLHRLADTLREARVPTWLMDILTTVALPSNVANSGSVHSWMSTNATLQEMQVLYNVSNRILSPAGPLSGASRTQWSNIGSSSPYDYGIVNIGDYGRLQLTSRFEALRSIYAEAGTDMWLSGGQPPLADVERPPECKPDLIVNSTSSLWNEVTLTLATDWVLPTRPAGLDALITSGASGMRGQMVDVTVTTVAHTVLDAQGRSMSDLVLRPSKSEARSTTARETGSLESGGVGSSDSDLSVGAKAGIGAGVGGGVLVALVGLGLVLWRRRLGKIVGEGKSNAVVSEGYNGDGIYRKVELPADGKSSFEPRHRDQMAEVPGDQSYPMRRSELQRSPVELPAVESAQELPGRTDDGDGGVR